MTSYWNVIPALAALIAGGSVFVFCREIRNYHKYIAFTLIFEGLFLMLQNIIYSRLQTFSTLVYLLYIIMMLTSPFLYYFASIYFLKKEGISKKDFWMLEAVAAFAIIFLFVERTVPIAEKNAFVRILGSGLPTGEIGTGTAVMLSLDNAAYLFFLTEQLFVQVFCFVNLVRYRKLLGQYYSNLHGKSPDKLTAIFILVTLRFIAFVCLSLVPSATASPAFSIAVIIVFCLFYVAISFYVCNIRYTAEELSELTAKEEKRLLQQTKVPAADETIAARLESLVNENFYLDPDVDLFSIATRIKVNTKYIADFLKFHYGETFLNWVNRLRIEHAIDLMNDKKLSLLDIAERSGYSSISTFYRNFSKIKGIPPSDFRKNTR